MLLIHNQLNQNIAELGRVVAKGQPLAKHNKDRRIRKVLWDMRASQETPPTMRDLWFYWKMWVRSKFARKVKE